MSSQDRNEMEEIQRGLESFLEKELDVIGSQERSRKAAKAHSTQNDKRLRDEEYFQENRDFTGPEQYREEEAYLYRGEEETEEPDLDIIGGVREIGRPWNAEYGQRRVSRQTGYPQAEGDFRGGQQSSSRGSRQGQFQSEGNVHSRTREAYSGEGQRQLKSMRKEEIRQEEVPKRSKRPQKDAQHGLKEDLQMGKDTREAQKSSKKKGRKRKRRLRKFLIIAALIFGVLGFGWYQLVGVLYGKMIYHEIESVADAPLKEQGVVNILLIGNDSRMNGEDGRSDAMILLSISSRTKKIYMTSLLRDIYVEIPGYEGNRLNAAYSFGGAELLMETIEKNFDIPINRYVLVNFEAFANLVDAVDGVELELSAEEIEYVNGYLVEYNMLTDRPQGTDNMDPSMSGLVHLNGPQALAYCRNRYLGTDFGRTERQRKVLTAVIKKLPSNLLTGAGELMNGLMPNLTTNLTRNECLRLSLMAGRLFTYEIVSDSIPQPGTYWNADIRGMAVLGVDFDSNIAYLREKLYGE